MAPQYMDVSEKFYARAALPPGKRPRYPLDKWLGGPQSRSERSCEEINIPVPAGDRTPVIQSLA
jgi:hypothetical protein